MFGDFPVGFDGVEFWGVWGQVDHGYEWVLCDEISHGLGFVKSCVVKDEDIFLFSAKCFDECSQEAAECQTIL